MKRISRRSECPISYTLDIFGDKWTMLIIRDLLFYGKDSFSEFLCSDEKIATKVLELLLQCDRYMTDEGPEQKEDCCSQLHANHLCLSW
jgi:hypothetical protein